MCAGELHGRHLDRGVLSGHESSLVSLLRRRALVVTAAIQARTHQERLGHTFYRTIC